MPAATLQTKGGVTNIVFGIAADANGLVTTKITVNKKRDRKELKNKFGDTFALAYYNTTTDVSGEGSGTETTSTIGTVVAAITAATAGVDAATITGKILLDSIDYTFSQDDFVKVKWSGTAYEEIV
jgi:hypothetical protein